ncbi:MAG TPA: tRNA preQ1(34) S-adenosylmethionine ribosyltransferase-isomerase QueA [Nitrospiraceae bacterium]|nr:tRNA preQ1(34) S-adenosylmethionine ribosyltransferase-isomerase QueA [Nitrospiraceae bacterium]
MLLSDFNFPFDPSLIAAHPEIPRDQARLLVLDRATGDLSHHLVTDLPDLLHSGDLVVANDTKVLPARVGGRVVQTGKAVDILFVRDAGHGTWEVLIKGKLRKDHIIQVGQDVRLTVTERSRDRTTVRMEGEGVVDELMQKFGMMPLPPYIKRPPGREDHEWYQTVFARAEGAIAAPTAGLHFTERLLADLQHRGIAVATVTLHVGPGTFRPVSAARIEDHQMEAEIMEVSEQTAQMVQDTRAHGGKVIAIGTTVTRALESAVAETGRLRPFRGLTSLFIRPGFAFRAVDGVVTNFHLPRTTLLMLVSAFAGTERLREAYGAAVAARYRFYSYGDAMLVR